jgi:hypothetical protein
VHFVCGIFENLVKLSNEGKGSEEIRGEIFGVVEKIGHDCLGFRVGSWSIKSHAHHGVGKVFLVRHGDIRVVDREKVALYRIPSG